MCIESRRTIVRCNAWKILFPSHMLPIHLPEIGNKEGFLGINFVDYSGQRGTHNPIANVNVGVSTMEIWKIGKDSGGSFDAMIGYWYGASGHGVQVYSGGWCNICSLDVRHNLSRRHCG